MGKGSRDLLLKFWDPFRPAGMSDGLGTIIHGGMSDSLGMIDCCIVGVVTTLVVGRHGLRRR